MVYKLRDVLGSISDSIVFMPENYKKNLLFYLWRYSSECNFILTEYNKVFLWKR